MRANSQFSLAYLGNDTYVIGMKNQLNALTLHEFDMKVRFISDEMGFILMNSVDHPTTAEEMHESPYCLSLYVVLEKITKQELPQNVITYYNNNYALLLAKVLKYGGEQGMGFICWRFIINQ